MKNDFFLSYFGMGMHKRANIIKKKTYKLGFSGVVPYQNVICFEGQCLVNWSKATTVLKGHAMIIVKSKAFVKSIHITRDYCSHERKILCILVNRLEGHYFEDM